MARYRSETHSTNRHRDRRLNHSRQRSLLAFLLHLATLSSTHLNLTRQKLESLRRQFRDPLQLPLPLRSSMVIPLHALNMAQLGSALEITGSSDIRPWVMTCITWPIFEEIEDFFSHFQNNVYWQAPVMYCGCHLP